MAPCPAVRPWGCFLGHFGQGPEGNAIDSLVKMDHGILESESEPGNFVSGDTEKLKGVDSMAHFFEVTKGTIVPIATVVTIVTGVTIVCVIAVVTITIAILTDV